MNIGKLNKRIRIMLPVDIPDGQGGRTRKWNVKYTVWGSIKVPRASSQIIQAAPSSELIYEVVIRRLKEELTGAKLACDGKEYVVLHAYDGYDYATVMQVREIMKRR